MHEQTTPRGPSRPTTSSRPTPWDARSRPSGPSTTVRILSTLSRPDSGAVRVAGHDVLKEPAAVRHTIGLVSQKPSAAPLMTGRESLEMAARIQGLGRDAARRRTGELLDRF